MAQIFKVLSRGLATSSAAMSSLRRITVIGGGIMGSGIAQISAQHGKSVTLVDVNQDVLNKAVKNIETSLQRISKKIHKDDTAKAEQAVKSALENLKFSVDIHDSVKRADLVIEAIVERINAKQTLFSTIDSVAPKQAIFATNTSSLSVTEIGSVTNRKDRFIGLHFFNPVPVMKLLEVVRSNETSDETYKELMAWGRSIGKTCITCKDTPGFVVNRLLVPQLAEAVRLLEKGVASARDIDIAMKLGAGHPMGPFELADYVGLDTTKYILEGWHQMYPDVELFRPVETLNKLVNKGKLGVKSGEGFYNYKK